MLLRLGIEATALSSSTPDLPPPVQAQHQVVMEQLVELGVLVDDRGVLRESIRGIRHVGLRKRWQKILKRIEQRIERPDTGLNSGPVSVSAMRLMDLDVALLSRTGAAACELPEDKCAYVPHPGLAEVVRFDSAAMSERVSHAKIRRQSAVEKGTQVDSVWHERFRPFAERYSSVVIVDRYAGTRCVTGGARSGLARALVRFQGTKCLSGLKIYTGAQNDAHARQVRSAIIGLPGAEGLRENDLVVGPDDRFRDLAHGRYLRFCDQVVCVDTGLHVLEGAEVPARCAFHVHMQVASCRDVEKLLRESQFGAE